MLLAIGMTLVIATGGVDLSVGAVMAISASVAAHPHQPRIFGSASGNITRTSATRRTASCRSVVILALAGRRRLCGLWNGLLVAYGRIQPMVATLILMIAGPGIAQLITNGVQDQHLQRAVRLPRQRLDRPAVLAVHRRRSCSLATWLLTRRTAIGLFIESVGINFRSSFYSGINEKRVKLFAYVFCGFCAGIAGLIAVSSIRTSDANQIGLYSELDAILAVVIGGTVLGAGGRFSLLGSVIGALVIQATTTSMYAIGVPASAITRGQGRVVVIVVILLLSVQVRDWRPRSRRAATERRADDRTGCSGPPRDDTGGSCRWRPRSRLFCLAYAYGGGRLRRHARPAGLPQPVPRQRRSC